jgi:hypothetical protein
MLTDPFTTENGGADITTPRIISPNVNTGRFRYEGSGGAYGVWDFIQSDNGSRRRHIARYTAVQAALSDGTHPSMTLTLTIDEPSGNTISDTDMLYFWNTHFKGSLSDAIVTKLLNGEV